MIHEIAIVVTDAERRIQWVNDAFSRLTGFSFLEAVGKKPGQLLQGPHTEPEVVRRIRKGLESFLPLQEDITNYRKNGEEYCCRLVIHPIFNDQNVLTNFIAFEADKKDVEHLDVPALKLKNKYLSSSLKGPDGAELYSRLQGLMTEERLFLDPHIGLKELADRLNTNTKYLSQVVNLHSGKNLQIFINEYRINEAKQKLMKEELSNLTLYGVAMQCGFKNKSTFYKVFKQLTEKTPMEFIREEKKKAFLEQNRRSS